jgi:hypothetical protein
VEDTKISKSKREISERSDLVIKHQAVAWTVHWFHSITLTFNLPHKDIFFVSSIMTRSLPKFQVENIRGKHFLISTNTILFTNQLNKFVVNLGAVRVEEGTTRRQFMVIEKLLSTANSAVISLFGLLLKVNVFIESFLIGERYSVNTLQAVVLCITEPVSG